MQVKVHIRTESEGTNFVIDAPDKQVIVNVLSSFINEDVYEVVIKKQHRNGTANVRD